METYIGQICQFPWPWAPEGWAACNGAVLPIQHNEALYSLLGNEFGGTPGQSFALPDLRPKDEAGNPVQIYVGETWQGKPWIPSYIATTGIYPARP